MAQKDLKTDRLLLGLGMLVFFAWGFIYRISLPDSVDPLPLRILGTILIAAILVSSFASEFVRNNFTRLIYGLLYIFTLHEAYLLYLNKVSTEFFIDYIVLIIIFNAYFKKPRHLIYYGIYSVILVTLVCILTPGPSISPGYVISTIITIDCLVLPIFISRLNMQEKLSYNEGLMKSIYNESTDSIFLIDPETKHIVDCNQCSMDTFRHTDKQLIINKKFTEHIQMNLSPLAMQEAEEVIREGGIWKTEIESSVSGSVFWGDVALKRIQAGARTLWLLRITDVTQRKITALKLENKTRALESSNVELEQMAYVASHDLQEPLRTITSYVQLLQRRYKDKIDEEANEFINYIVEGTERMRALIQDLLTYSRVGAYNKKLEIVDTGKVVNMAIKNLIQPIKESKAEIKISPSMPQLQANEFEMLELFQNLISNALEFRNSISPVIELKVQELYEEKTAYGSDRTVSGWLFSLRDNGIGIQPEYKDRIFRIFQRLHPRDKYSGTGIGLAICKKVVERYGGKIWVESQINEGSTFYFTLYRKPAEAV